MSTAPTIPCVALTINQAATALGVCRQTVMTLLKTNRLRHVRVGRRVIIPRDAVHEFLNQPLH